MEMFARRKSHCVPHPLFGWKLHEASLGDPDEEITTTYCALHSLGGAACADPPETNFYYIFITNQPVTLSLPPFSDL